MRRIGSDESAELMESLHGLRELITLVSGERFTSL